MTRIDPLWLFTPPQDMRTGADWLLNVSSRAGERWLSPPSPSVYEGCRRQVTSVPDLLYETRTLSSAPQR